MAENVALNVGRVVPGKLLPILWDVIQEALNHVRDLCPRLELAGGESS
jgi:hypothetical protein